MSADSFLSWPFFEERHRNFTHDLRAWIESHKKAPGLDHVARAKAWVSDLAAGGWLLRCIPPLDVRTLCLARESLAYHDPLADFAFAMQGLGAGPISQFGTQAQKDRYLPSVANGRTIVAFAISEREAGSDVAAVQTTAHRDEDAYFLNGEKTWTSNAGIASVYIVFARTSDAGSKGLSAFVVRAATAGLKAVGSIETLYPHPLGELRLRNCKVPLENRIGEEGDGFKIAMATLDIFRPTVGAAALGLARRAFDEAVRHVQTRKVFGKPLAAQQLTQTRIAQMATDIDAAALLVYRAAYNKDCGAARITREAAMAKWFATERAWRVIDSAVQLFGGRGVTRGEVVEELYRAVRALRIYEGSSEIQQIVIARTILGSHT